VEYFFLVSIANPNSRINFSQKRLRERRDKHIYIYIAWMWVLMRMRVERHKRVEKTNSKITALINLHYISKNYVFRLSCWHHYLIPLSKIYKMNSSFDRWAGDN
jgi:hypothetical protein